jgi:hypothetical protein
MQLDFSLDPQTWDDVEPVLYLRARVTPSVADLPPVFNGMTPAPPTPPDRDKPIYMTLAKRRNLRRHELSASGGVYTAGDQVYLIPDNQFPLNTPSKPGDVVVDLVSEDEGRPGTRWTILEVGWGKNRNTRRFMCRDLVLSYELRDSITIERPLLVYDQAGVPVKHFPSDGAMQGITLYADLPARCQLISKAIAEKYAIRGLEGKYRIVVGQELDVSQEDRVILPNGEYCDIVGYENAMRIDELPVVIAERKV